MKPRRLIISAMAMAYAASVIGGGIALAQDDSVTYTGCIDGDANLVNVAVGDEPAAPCDESTVLATWNQEGPQGKKGEQGEQGEKGNKGDPGTSATYILSQELSEPVMVSAKLQCDEGDLVTGGGFQRTGGPPTTVVESFPSGKRGWTVTLVATDGSLVSIKATVYSVCSDLEPLRS